jgi:hypothetical protein
VLRVPQLPGFLLKSDMFMRVRVRVISNEVFAGGLILPLGYCSAHVVLPCTAMVCVNPDSWLGGNPAQWTDLDGGTE